MPRSTSFNAVHPVLPVRDMARSVAFYKRLGFMLVMQDAEEAPNYAVVRRDAVEVHLQTHDPVEWEGGHDRPLLRVLVDAPDALYADYTRLDVLHPQTELRDTPWGTREFGLYDPDRNGLIFYRDLDG